MSTRRAEPQSATEILRLFETRREHCRNLLELSRRQIELIDGDDYTQLLSVLGRKQRILGALDELKMQHPQLMQRWQAQRTTADATMRDDCEHVLAETETILAELIKEEDDSTRRLTQRRNATQQKLQTISKGTQTHQAYRDSLAPVTHRYLDVDQ